MDFEVLKSTHDPVSWRDTLLRYFNVRRKQLQDWDATPPIILGFLIFLSVAIELSVSIQLIRKEGVHLKLITLGTVFAFFLFVVEVLFISTAGQMAKLFNKRGKIVSAWTFLNVGLIPYLAFLPMMLCVYLWSGSVALLFLWFFVLTILVLSNWKEGIEVAFELSRLQSAIVVYLMSGMMMLLCGFVLYASLFKVLADFL